MSITTINQSWHGEPAGRTWNVTLTVSAVDLPPDEIAALTPVIEAIETYTASLHPDDHQETDT